MSIGYTECIKDGISFEDFVMRCARALDEQIPYESKVDIYFEKRRLLCLRNKLRRFVKKYTRCRVGRLKSKAKIITEYNNSIGRYKRSIEASDYLEQKYLDMLMKVNNWAPPTNDHTELKGFMVDKISKSIEFDCIAEREYYRDRINKIRMKKDNIENWRSDNIKNMLEDIRYYKDQLEEEIHRVNERNKWIKDLRGSLYGK